MTKNDLINFRLQNQRIQAMRLERPAEVAHWMGALQAQDYAQAVWAVGLRTHSATLAEVEGAIAAGELIRTWPMRGTLHFVTPQDARWMLGLSSERMLAAARGRYTQLGLDAATFSRAQQLFYDELRGGKQLPRPRMLQLLERAGISTAGQRGIHILGQAAISGLICIGPREGRQHTFTLLEEVAPPSRVLSRDEALAELAARYFTSHGPATLRDFVWWGGLTLTDARAGLAAARGLASLTVGGTEYWLPAAALDAGAPDSGGVHLLPGFDEYFIGYTDRSAIVSAQDQPRVTPGNNGMFHPMLVVDGQVAGTWKRVVGKQGLSIALSPFTPGRISPQRVADAARRYSDFMGMRLVEVLDSSKIPSPNLKFQNNP